MYDKYFLNVANVPLNSRDIFYPKYFFNVEKFFFSVLYTSVRKDQITSRDAENRAKLKRESEKKGKNERKRIAILTDVTKISGRVISSTDSQSKTDYELNGRRLIDQQIVGRLEGNGEIPTVRYRNIEFLPKQHPCADVDNPSADDLQSI